MSDNKPRSIERRVVKEEVSKVMEFAWAAGIINWTPEQYAEAMTDLFPEDYCDDEECEGRKQVIKKEKDREFRLISADND